MKFIVFAMCVFFASVPARACLNESEKPQQAPLPPTVAARLDSPESDIDWKVRYHELDARNSPDIGTQNDLAVALVHLGQYAKALAYFKAIESNTPGLYRTAANIGTTYELLGENAHALRWIREGLKRNVESHNGSEWIHLRILEAKNAGTSPDLPSPDSVIGLDFGDGAAPSAPLQIPVDAKGQTQTLKQVEDALIFQLHERLQFVRAPDKTVASLLFDLGNTLALRGDHAQAVEIYGRALKFGPRNRDLVQRRADAAAPRSPLPLYFALAALVVGSAGAFEIWQRRRARINGVQILSMGDGTRPNLEEWSPPRE